MDGLNFLGLMDLRSRFDFFIFFLGHCSLNWVFLEEIVLFCCHEFCRLGLFCVILLVAIHCYVLLQFKFNFDKPSLVSRCLFICIFLKEKF